MIGSITQLRLKGNLCPCLLSSADSTVYTSDSELSSIFQTIQWHQLSSSKNSNDDNDDDDGDETPKTKNSKKGFWANMTSNISSASSSIIAPKILRVPASCSISDIGGILTLGGSSGIQLELFLDEDYRDDGQDRNRRPQSKLCIPFRSIGSIRPYVPSSSWTNAFSDGGNGGGDDVDPDHLISIYGLLQNDSNNGSEGGYGEELARLELIELSHPKHSNMTRDDVIEHLQQLVQWDKRHMDDVDRLEQDLEANLESTGGLRGRAQKAAHFAKREIEMQKQRREREQRKAKYVKEAGGLKYTAIAMANRS